MNRWFVSQQGKLKGPFTLAQLTAMIRAGDLKPEDMLRPESGGSPTWASRVPGLFSPAEPEPAVAKPAPSVAVTAKPAAAPVGAVVASQPPVGASPSALSAAAASRSHAPVLIVGGVIAGLFLLCVLPVAGLGLMWVFSGKENKKEDEPIRQAELKAETQNTQETKKPKDPPPPDPRIKIVQPAVDKGVAYLKLKGPGLANHRLGVTGLNGLTLLECGVPPDDPAIVRIADLIRKAAPHMNQVYDLSTSLFFLNRWDEGQPLNDDDTKMARSFALRIISGQLNSGIWAYAGDVMTPAQEASLLRTLEDGTYRPNGRILHFPSMSNTQFAMLAVWGSRKHGVPVRDPLLALAAYFHANQHVEGSWNYPNFSLKATSTCAGLISLAIEDALLDDKEFKSKPRQPVGAKKADVDKAFAFVAKTIGRKKGDPGAGSKSRGGHGMLFDADAIGDLYFLWTLERLGVIYSKEQIGGKDWFDWGYPIVMQAQQPDGSWHEKHPTNFGPLVDTSFALLFLKRANIARDLTEFIRTRGGKAAIP